MKKFLILLMALILSVSAVGLIACGGSENPEGPGGEQPPAYTVKGTEGLSYSISKRKDTNEEYAIFTGLKKDCTATEITIASHYKGAPVEEIGLVGKLSNFSKVEKVNIHKLVKVVGASAFYGAESLKEVNFDSEGVLDTLGLYAFKNCTKLETINLPSTIKAMSEGAFDGCTLLKYNEYEGANYIGSTAKPCMLLIKAKEGATKCKVNKDCQVICASAFENNTIISTIEFEDDNTLLNISANAFKGSGITSITIPSSVETIGNDAFSECPNLEVINLSTTTKITSIGERAFFGSNKLQYVNNFEKTRITVCNTAMFQNCNSLRTLVIPNTVEFIKSAFLKDCHSLYSVKFEENSQVTEFEEDAFYACTGLSELIIPKSLQKTLWHMTCYCRKDKLKIFMEHESKPVGVHSDYNKYHPQQDFTFPTYYYRETRPTESGNFWHYVDGKPEIW